MTSAFKRRRDRRWGGRWCSRVELVGAAWTLLAQTARAQDQLDLTWDAPAPCPRAGAVFERMRALAGGSLQRARRLHAEGRIVRLEGHYRLTLTVSDGESVRDRMIDAEVCADLAGAAAVTLGLLLSSEPESSASPSESESKTGNSGTSSPAPTPTRDREARALDEPPRDGDATLRQQASDNAPLRRTSRQEAVNAQSTRHRSTFVSAPLIALDVGRLLHPSLGAGVGLGVCREAWCASVVGRLFLDETQRSTDVKDVGVEQSRAMAEIWACRSWRMNGWALGPCLSAGVDSVTVRGVGPDVSARSLQSTSVVLGGGVSSHWYLADGVALMGRLGLGLQTSRPHLVIDGFGEVRQLGLLHAGLEFGTEWIF
jgi:hypothetical protein